MRIRPFCVFAILTWGLTWGAGTAAAQGFPAFGPNGYPPPGYGTPYPPPGYGMPFGAAPPGYFAPPPGMPMQGMPMQGMPMQGMPMQGMPMQGMPMPGMPMPGMPMQPMPMQGMPVQGTPVAPGFPGFAPYAGSQAAPTTPATVLPNVPVPSTPIPALPTGNAVAGDGAKGPSSGTPTAPAKGEKIAAPVAPPIRNAVARGAVPSTGVPTTGLPTDVPSVSEPMVSYIGGMPPGYLQPYSGPDDDHGGPMPQRPCVDHCWFSMSYLMGFIKPGVLPVPLLTTGSPANAHPGALGQPGTSTIFGNRLSYPMQSGFRTNFGVYVDNSGCYSLEGDLLYFLPVGVHFATQSNAAGVPILTRPFYDVSGATAPPSPGEHAYVIAAPLTTGFPSAGGTAINSSSDLYGFEVNGRYHWNCAPNWRADFLMGFRYLHLNESLLIQDNITLLAASPPFPAFGGIVVPAGAVLNDFDSFGTRNNFYGPQIGGRLIWQQDWLFVSGYGKLAHVRHHHAVRDDQRRHLADQRRVGVDLLGRRPGPAVEHRQLPPDHVRRRPRGRHERRHQHHAQPADLRRLLLPADEHGGAPRRAGRPARQRDANPRQRSADDRPRPPRCSTSTASCSG